MDFPPPKKKKFLYEKPSRFRDVFVELGK